MKKNLIRWIGAVSLAVITTMLTSCATTDDAEDVDVAETPDGAVIVDTMTKTATVTAVDPATRKVSLAFEGGGKTTYKCGPEVVNFGQIEVGDKVKAVVTEEVAVFLGSGSAPDASVAKTVALAPVGAKPGGVFVQTAQATAKITAVDAKKRHVSLELPDGSLKTVKVGKQVNLRAVKPGDNITIQLSEGLALSVQKP